MASRRAKVVCPFESAGDQGHRRANRKGQVTTGPGLVLWGRVLSAEHSGACGLQKMEPESSGFSQEMNGPSTLPALHLAGGIELYGRTDRAQDLQI